MRAVNTKKILLSEYLTGRPDAFEKSTDINELYKTELLPLLDEDNTREARLSLQYALQKQFFESSNIPDDVKRLNQKLFMDEMIGTGMTDYITIGKYKAHRTKLMGGKLQMRSHNNNQVHNLKSQNISKNIRDILLKLNKNETIHFSDVDKLTTEEKNQLYMIGKKYTLQTYLIYLLH